MRPTKLTLKGFIGIKAGMGVDQIAIDFSGLDGIIVFNAPNGSGKTTILDNLHPYRLMPYRMPRADSPYKPSAFSYYDNCYGEFIKELFFEMGGTKYRSLVTGDAGKKKQEAYLYYTDPTRAGEWVIYPGIDGKLEAYDRAIEEVCGSSELFFTSIFRAQNAKALSDYKKGDIKDLFVELLGVERLQLIGEKARRVKQGLVTKYELLQHDAGKLVDVIATRPRIEEALIGLNARKAQHESERAHLQSMIVGIDDRLRDLAIKIEVQRAAIGGKAAIEKELLTKQEKLTQAKASKIATANRLGEKVKALELKIHSVAAAEATLVDLTSQIAGREQMEKDLSDTLETLTRYREDLTGIERDLDARRKEGVAVLAKQRTRDKLEHERTLKKQAAELALQTARKQAELLDTVPCTKGDHAEEYKGSCQFIKGAAAAREQLTDLETAVIAFDVPDIVIESLNREIEDGLEIAEGIVTLEGKAKILKGDILALSQDEKIARDELARFSNVAEKIAEVKASLAMVPAWREELQAASLELAQADTLSTFEVESIEEDIRDLEGKAALIVVDPAIEIEKDSLEKERADLDKKLGEQETSLSSTVSVIGAAHADLRKVDEAEAEAEKIRAAVDYLGGEISEWSTLEKAFGNDGIIALEIDDAGPQVSAIANQLLQVFGGRFAVKIDTQGTKADGGTKEVFDIVVFDTRTNESKSIRRMSGGERTWVEDSITKAICVYNKDAAGRDYQTIFTDEKDGALDPEKKREFFQMKRRVLELGNYRREFAITQTKELQDLADVVITLDGGQVVITKN